MESWPAVVRPLQKENLYYSRLSSASININIEDGLKELVLSGKSPVRIVERMPSSVNSWLLDTTLSFRSPQHLQLNFSVTQYRQRGTAGGTVGLRKGEWPRFYGQRSYKTRKLHRVPD